MGNGSTTWRRRRGRSARGLTLAGGLVWVWVGAAAAACDPGSVELRTPAGSMMRFSVELADDGVERAKGLMFRDRMARGAGMLFVYETPRRASFWMKNTLIPLDMVFADPTGTVTRVHAGARPGDLTSIDGGDGVLAVLEINGGLAARLGIVPGTVMRHPAFDPATAALPCVE